MMTLVLPPDAQARLALADHRRTAQMAEVARLLCKADGRAEDYSYKPWNELPPLYRVLADNLRENVELRNKLVAAIEDL